MPEFLEGILERINNKYFINNWSSMTPLPLPPLPPFQQTNLEQAASNRPTSL